MTAALCTFHPNRRDAELRRLEVDRAEAAKRARRNVLAPVSRGLRTPLNAVPGCAQLLRQDPGSTELERRRASRRGIERARWEPLELIERMVRVGERRTELA